jgi:hypothetical protein
LKFFISCLLQIGSEDIPFEEKLTKKIETHFDVIREDPRFPLFFFTELSTNPKRLQTLKEMLGDMPQVIVKQFQEELQKAIESGRVRPMSVFDLLITMVSLNLMVFIGEPVFKAITKIPDDDFLKLVERRKKENVHFILKGLKP